MSVRVITNTDNSRTVDNSNILRSRVHNNRYTLQVTTQVSQLPALGIKGCSVSLGNQRMLSEPWESKDAQ